MIVGVAQEHNYKHNRLPLVLHALDWCFIYTNTLIWTFKQQQKKKNFWLSHHDFDLWQSLHQSTKALSSWWYIYTHTHTTRQCSIKIKKWRCFLTSFAASAAFFVLSICCKTFSPFSNFLFLFENFPTSFFLLVFCKRDPKDTQRKKLVKKFDWV